MEKSLIRAKLLGGISLREIITEQNHGSVVDELLSMPISDMHGTKTRMTEYIESILPRAFKNEDPKKRLLDRIGELRAIYSLISVDKNGAVICLRSDLIQWALHLLIDLQGFSNTIDEACAYWNNDPTMAKVDRLSVICRVFAELMPERAQIFIETSCAIHSLGFEKYSRLYEALNVDPD